jgi:hypothetical protein
MDRWEGDHDFREAAQVLWPDDFTLATLYVPAKGKSAAIERIQLRYEGFRSIRGLGRLRDGLDRIIRRATGVSIG